MIVIYKYMSVNFQMQFSLTVPSISNHSSSSKKRSPADLPIQYVEPAMRRDTPQLDHPDHHDSALTTMRRLEDPNKPTCSLFAAVESVKKQVIQYDKSTTSESKHRNGYHVVNTREHRKQRMSENIDPSLTSSEGRVESSISSNREEIVVSATKPAGTGLSFLYSSVKNALRDNINTLDFSRRHQEPKKQQLRYQVNTQDSEHSMILDNEGALANTQTFSQNDRRQSNQTEKGVGSGLCNLGEAPLRTSSSFKRMPSCNDQEVTEPTVKKSISKRQLMLQEENSNEPLQQTALRQSSRFYHTFSNDQQTTLGTSIRHRDSIHSHQRSSQKALPTTMDPATPMFSCQKGGLYQSMQIPKSSHREDEEGQERETPMHDPQIISRTIGLMQLNSSSSCQSLDHLRDQVFNLTIKRPNVIEDDSRCSADPMIDVSAEAIYLKKKRLPSKKAPPTSAGQCGLSRTQKLYLGGGCLSHQQSKQLGQPMSRILSPLSQKSTIVHKMSAATTPTVQKKQTVKKRPKSSGSTNTANTSLFKSNTKHIAANGRSSAVSFSGLSHSNTFIQPSAKASMKKLLPSIQKPKQQKSRQPSLSLHHSSFAARSVNSRCPSQHSITRAFSPTYGSTVIHTGKSTVIARPSSTMSVKKRDPSQQSNGSVVIIKKKSKSNATRSPLNVPPQQTLGRNITLKNQASRSTIVSFSGKQVPQREVSPMQQVMGKCNIIRKGLQQRGQVINDKNEVVTRMIEDKKLLVAHIAAVKKKIIQNQKQAKTVKDNNKQIQDDVVRLAELVNQKVDRNVQLQREIALAKKDVRALQQDCEDLRQDKNKLMLKIESEYQLVDVVQRLIVNLKKQTNEIRREKEKLQIAVKGEQRKTIDVISKRRTLITEESEKIYMDFKDTIGGAGGGPCIPSLNTSQIMLGGHGYSSRSQLHTPKGLNGK